MHSPSSPVPQFFGQQNSGGNEYNESWTFPTPSLQGSNFYSQPLPFPKEYRSPSPSYASGPPQNSSYSNFSTNDPGPFRDSSTSCIPCYGGQPSPSFPAPQTSTYYPNLLPTPPTYGRLDNYSPSRGQCPPPSMPIPSTNSTPYYSGSFPKISQNLPVHSLYPPPALYGSDTHFAQPVMNNYSLPHQSSQLPYSNGAQYPHAQAPARPLQRSPPAFQLPPTAHSSSEMMGGLSGPGDPRWPTMLFSNNKYNNCPTETGRRRSLCVGINYEGQDRALRGAVNDAVAVRDFLIDHGGYNPSDIVLLNDHSNDRDMLPTLGNILAQMCLLTRDAQPNDSLFFHFSGHGGLTKDLNRDELLGLGKDSVIYTVDGGQIVDDTMHDIMVKSLPKGCRLTALFDACHSGTALDLPYVYNANGSLTIPSLVDFHARALKKSSADVVSWSSCRDREMSADTFVGDTPVGAMSNAFIGSLTNRPSQTYQELLVSVRSILHEKYRRIPQHPQLGSSHRINTKQTFVF